MQSNNESFQFLEYHSLIPFSGSKEGFCLVTANIPWLEKIGKAMLQENIIDPEMYPHIISEFTNGIAANSGANLHEDYDILPPVKNEIKNLEAYHLPIYNIQAIEFKTDIEHCRLYVGMK
jgi:CheY-specific phosphatase CheX